MAILNYGNQFRYSGVGYIDNKMAPVNSVEELEIRENILISQYSPGMKVTVLDDGEFGTVDYILNEKYEWKRVVDLDKLTLSLDKGDYEGDSKSECYLQLHYTNVNDELVALGQPLDLSILLEDVEKRIDDLEKQGGSSVEDTNTYIVDANIVTEKDGESGLFIKFDYNNGSSFYSDIEALKQINEEWFGEWFEGKIVEFNERFESIEENIATLSQALTALSGNVTANADAISSIVQQIAANVSKLEEVESTANETKSKVTNLSSQLAAIRGVEYIKAGANINVESNEDGFVTISANVPDVDTTELETRIGDVEEIVSEHSADITSLRQAIENLAPEGGALTGDGETIITNNGLLSVQISSNELNILKANANGLFAQGVEMILGDDEINEEENN